MKNEAASIYQFKVTLRDISPLIWRQIQVRGNISLHRFATVMLIAMGWSGGHLHQFHIAGKQYGMPTDEEGPDAEMDIMDERQVILQDFGRDKLNAFRFEYDFGDGWMHSVKLEQVLEAKKGERFPKCVDGARHCPPDDCGGTDGYEDFLAAIKNPKHPEHESKTEWIGGEFDPETFNLDFVNNDLRGAARMEKLWYQF